MITCWVAPSRLVPSSASVSLVDASLSMENGKHHFFVTAQTTQWLKGKLVNHPGESDFKEPPWCHVQTELPRKEKQWLNVIECSPSRNSNIPKKNQCFNKKCGIKKGWNQTWNGCHWMDQSQICHPQKHLQWSVCCKNEKHSNQRFIVSSGALFLIPNTIVPPENYDKIIIKVIVPNPGTRLVASSDAPFAPVPLVRLIL